MVHFLGSVRLLPGFMLGFFLGAILLLCAGSAVLTFFLALPGIIAHEIAHFSVAFILRAAPRSLQLFPQKLAPGLWSLGRVRFEPHWFSAGFVALAPGYLLPLLVWAAYRQALGSALLPQILWGYLTVVLLWFAAPSRTDWALALRHPAGSLVVLVALGTGLRAVLQ